MKRSVRGFTLIELMVTISIMVMLLFMAVPLAGDWVNSSRTLQARGALIQGYARAKSIALRNPCQAISGAAATELKASTDGNQVTLTVSVIDPSATCAYLSAKTNPQWSAVLPAGVDLTLSGAALAPGVQRVAQLDNRGLPNIDTTFTLSRGGNQNDETGTLQ